MAAAADFLGNFLVVEITPSALNNIGYRTYIIFAVLNIANAIIVWCFYPETGGLPLESIDKLFTEESLPLAHHDAIHRKLQWSMVGKAAAAVKRRKTQLSGLDFESHSESDSVDHSKASDKYVEGAARRI